MGLDHVFRNMYNFVVKGDELIIHFTGGENKNLLILKKRTPPHELIAANLLKMGNSNQELLFGEWNCTQFAYTPDGNTISKVADINTGDQREGRLIRISNEGLWLTTTDILIRPPRPHFEIQFDCSITGNLIGLSIGFNYPFLYLPPGEIDVAFALINAYSFVITEDELIIYFTGTDNRNLLIFKKIKK